MKEFIDVIEAPVFVIGSGRCGSSWVQRILLSLPQVSGGQESYFFMEFGPILRHFQNRNPNSRPVGLPNYWTKAGLTEEFRALWSKTMSPLVKAKPGTQLLIEKSPGHAYYIPEILEVLPKAKFVHIIRDSRAVVSSLLAAGKDGWWVHGITRDVKQSARHWNEVVLTAMRDGNRLGPERYLELHYEDLLANTVDGIERLTAFAGLKIDRTEIQRAVSEQAFSKQKESGGTPFLVVGENAGSGAQREPKGFFRKGVSDSWKEDLTLPQKLIVWQQTKDLLKICGYDWSGRRTSKSGPGA